MSSPCGFRNAFGGFLDEGVTQYFTDLVLEEQGLDRMKGHLYKDELDCANRLVDPWGFPWACSPAGTAIGVCLAIPMLVFALGVVSFLRQ